MLVILLIVFCLYLFLLFFAWAFSERLMFPISRRTYADNPAILKLQTADGLRISAVYLPIPGAKYTLLFSHGNGEDLGTSRYLYRLFQECGFSVFAYDYHGYGTSEGRPSEKSVYMDIRAAYDYLVNNLRVPPNRIICHGRSIGGGPSVDLAAQELVAGLILESAFVTAFCVATWAKILPFDKFCNVDKLARVNCPVLVIHATNDWIIPFWHGRRLFRRAAEPKMHLWVESGGHNSLVAGAGYRYKEALQAFAEMIDREQEHDMLQSGKSRF